MILQKCIALSQGGGVRADVVVTKKEWTDLQQRLQELGQIPIVDAAQHMLEEKAVNGMGEV